MLKNSHLPVLLDHTRAWRVYLGGSWIRALHENPGTQDDYFPKEWIASTVEAVRTGAQPEAGLSHLQDQPSFIFPETFTSGSYNGISTGLSSLIQNLEY